MSEEQSTGESTFAGEETPAAGATGGGEQGHRLPNLGKLYHVPVFALRELLASRVSGQRFTDLRQAELVAEADRQIAITEADVDQLYENFRYGRSLAFYLYLLPDGLVEPEFQALQGVLDDLAAPERPGLDDEVASSEDYEGEQSLNQIVLLDEEWVNGIREIRLRYHVAHRFLNADEQPDQVLQTRYGFLWLDLGLGYLVVLSRDERINNLLTLALSTCLQAIPVPVRFPQELVDKHFSIEKVRRVSHFDPGTGIRQSLSGRGLWKAFEKEIQAREQRYIRPSSMYEEQVADGVTSGLGITASKGKIYLTRTLPTSLVRAWGVQRLPDLVRDVKDLRAQEPEIFSRSLETINRMRLPAAGKSAIIHIVEALLRAEREHLVTVELPLRALEIYEALEGKYFNPYLRTQCSKCDEMAELCPHCDSAALDVDEQQVSCEACGASLWDGDAVVLRCMNGHLTRVPYAEAFSIAPNHWLQKRMVRIFADIGQAWSEDEDYFHVEASTLYRLRRGAVEPVQQPQPVQQYISHFWEPVSGPVHMGGGDIIAAGAAPGERREGEPVGPRMTYRDFDLRVRGSEISGYTVEAAASDGGSVPPQSLALALGPDLVARFEGLLGEGAGGEEIQGAGEALFNALFPTRVLKLWTRTVGGLEESEGLRLRLRIDPPSLRSLPWELLYEDEYIGLRLRFPIVRYLDLLDPPGPLAVQPPLRVLVAVSRPQDASALDADAELAHIDQALGQLADRVEREILEHPTRDGLLDRLRRGFHALHYIGHGAFDGQEGYLVLEDEAGRSDPVSALLLGQMVADSQVRLAMLNACETARPLGGVAQHLVRGGLPAVVAMQRPVGDRAAVAFSRGFYGALATGWPVDTAVQEGRRSIVTAQGNEWHRSGDWAIPSLYMRAPDGVILEVQQGS